MHWLALLAFGCQSADTTLSVVAFPFVAAVIATGPHPIRLLADGAVQLRECTGAALPGWQCARHPRVVCCTAAPTSCYALHKINSLTRAPFAPHHTLWDLCVVPSLQTKMESSNLRGPEARLLAQA